MTKRPLLLTICQGKGKYPANQSLKIQPIKFCLIISNLFENNNLNILVTPMNPTNIQAETLSVDKFLYPVHLISNEGPRATSFHPRV